MTYGHVTAVTEAAVPSRYEAISSVEAALVELARTSRPASVRKAVQAIRDVAAPDWTGPDADDLGDDGVPEDVTDDDPRRYWNHSLTIDGLYAGSYVVGGILGELITTVFDAFGTPDPADTPLRQRRSPAQSGSTRCTWR